MTAEQETKFLTDVLLALLEGKLSLTNNRIELEYITINNVKVCNKYLTFKDSRLEIIQLSEQVAIKEAEKLNKL